MRAPELTNVRPLYKLRHRRETREFKCPDRRAFINGDDFPRETEGDHRRRQGGQVRILAGQSPAGHVADPAPLLRHAIPRRNLRRKLGDDFAGSARSSIADAYRDPEGRELFDAGLDRDQARRAGPFAHCEDPAEVERLSLAESGLPELRRLPARRSAMPATCIG